MTAIKITRGGTLTFTTVRGSFTCFRSSSSSSRRRNKKSDASSRTSFRRPWDWVNLSSALFTHETLLVLFDFVIFFSLPLLKHAPQCWQCDYDDCILSSLLSRRNWNFFSTTGSFLNRVYFDVWPRAPPKEPLLKYWRPERVGGGERGHCRS